VPIDKAEGIYGFSELDVMFGSRMSDDQPPHRYQAAVKPERGSGIREVR
jgi:hypothetical protein